MISKYKISWAAVKKPNGAVTRTVPSGPFRVSLGVFEREFTVVKIMLIKYVPYPFIHDKYVQNVNKI